MPKNFFYELAEEIEKNANTECEIDWWNTLYCTYDEESYKRLPEL